MESIVTGRAERYGTKRAKDSIISFKNQPENVNEKDFEEVMLDVIDANPHLQQIDEKSFDEDDNTVRN